MSHQEQINHFQHEIEAVVERFRAEYEITIAAAVGVLEIVKLDLWKDERPPDE